jgi:hypothetical protein
MSADHDALIHKANQLMSTRVALLHTMESLRREMERCLDASEVRIVRTKQLLADSAALLQHLKTHRHENSN